VSDHSQPLREQDADADPERQLAAWYEQAAASDMRMPEAAALATASPDGAPSLRMVLVKGFDGGVFRFYSNYDSRKGGELAANPRAALLFHWDELGRQVRIEGPVERASAADSLAYARSRARASQLSALSSPQSRVVSDRAELERLVAENDARYAHEQQLPLPERWGGFRLTAQRYEFWQQREDRLHDRLVYRRDGGDWLIERLAP